MRKTKKSKSSRSGASKTAWKGLIAKDARRAPSLDYFRGNTRR